MIGWYHSHPGYGCWLSGIDVGTQATQQMYQEPFLAIVIDPHRTIAAGKVEIGAFRTYPEVSDSIRLLQAERIWSVRLACFSDLSCGLKLAEVLHTLQWLGRPFRLHFMASLGSQISALNVTILVNLAVLLAILCAELHTGVQAA